MTSLNKSFTVLMVSLVGALLILAGVIFFKPLEQAFAGNVYQSPILLTATTSNKVAVTSSTRILATTTNALGNGTSYTRVFTSICNPSATLVYLNMNSDVKASLASSTAIIGGAAGYSACYEITDRNLYQGSIQASSTSETSVTVTVTDFVQ